MIEQNKKIIVYIILTFSIFLAAYEVALYLNGYFITEELSRLWMTILSYLVATWVYLDAKTRSDFSTPFDFGSLLLFLWIPYIPYYFIKTRRLAGLSYFIGVMILMYLGYLSIWIVYLVQTI